MPFSALRELAHCPSGLVRRLPLQKGMKHTAKVPTAPDARILEINDVESLEGLRLLWTRLLAETRGASFFHTLDWLLVYWRHYGAKQRLRVLVVYAGGEAIGILPLVVKQRGLGPAGVRVLTYPVDDWGTFYGPIGPNPTATLHLGLAHIQRGPRDWDVIELRWIDNRVDHGRTSAALQLVTQQCETSAADQVALIEFQGDWQGYLAGLGHKARVNLRRNERRLAAQGEVRVVRHRPAPAAQGDGDPRWDLYDICERLAQRSWQGSASRGTTMSHPSVREFLRDMHAAAARLGAVDICILYVGDQPVAFTYGYVWQGHVFGLRCGYDADAVRDGAGSVLMARLIEDSFERSDCSFNLGAGYLDAKRQWLTRIVPAANCTHYPPASPKAQAVRCVRSLRRWSQRNRGAEWASRKQPESSRQPGAAIGNRPAAHRA